MPPQPVGSPNPIGKTTAFFLLKLRERNPGCTWLRPRYNLDQNHAVFGCKTSQHTRESFWGCFGCGKYAETRRNIRRVCRGKPPISPYVIASTLHIQVSQYFYTPTLGSICHTALRCCLVVLKQISARGITLSPTSPKVQVRRTSIAVRIRHSPM